MAFLMSIVQQELLKKILILKKIIGLLVLSMMDILKDLGLFTQEKLNVF